MAVERKQIYDFDILPGSSWATPEDIWFIVDDHTGGGPNVPTYRLSGADVTGSVATQLHSVIVATGHGLTTADEKKPLAWNGTAWAIVDDTNASHHPAGWLEEVLDANTLDVIIQGLVTFPDSLMEPGYSLSVDGPFVYWDKSSDAYVSTIPGDSAATMREVLQITSITGGVVTAIKLAWGPLT